MNTLTMLVDARFVATSTCARCGEQVAHQPYGGPQRRHWCHLRVLTRLRWRAYCDGWDDGYRCGEEQD